MKRLIALIAMAASMAVNAQTVVSGDYQYNGNVYFAKGLFIPVKDTTGSFTYRVGALTVRPQDTTGHPLTIPIYLWTGRRWMNTTAGGGGTYTAGNGLTLSGSQFSLGGLSANTNIPSNGFGYGFNTGVSNRNTLSLSSGTGGVSRIGYNNVDGTFGGYEYLPDYGRGASKWYTKGVATMVYDYAGLRMSDTLGSQKLNIGTDGTMSLKQANGNTSLEVAPDKIFSRAATDTSFYVSSTQVTARALANTDPLKVLSADQFGGLKLVTAPGAATIYTNDGSIREERTITGDTLNGISWNWFNNYIFNFDDGAGNTANTIFHPYGFQFNYQPDAEPASTINYSAGNFTVSLLTAAGFSATSQQSAQIGQTSYVYDRNTGSLGINNERVEIQQGFTDDIYLYTLRHYATDGGGSAPVLFGIDSFGRVKLDRYKNNTAEDSVLTVDDTGHMKLKKVITSIPTFWGLGTPRDTSTLILEDNAGRGRFAQSIVDTLTVDGENDGTYVTQLSDSYSIEQGAATYDPAGGNAGYSFNNSTIYHPSNIQTSIQRQYLGTSFIYGTSVSNLPDSIKLLYSYNPNSSGIGTAKIRALVIDSVGTKTTGLFRGDSMISVGKVSGSVFNAYNATGTNFTSYYNFSHDGADTSKKTWSIGLQGTATAPIGNGGDSLKFRSYTTTGAVMNDLITMSRTGQIYMPGTVTIGPVTNTSTRLIVNGGGTFSNGIYAKGAGIRNGGALQENAIRTVTGDYTVAPATDLYINVNNSANCVITLSLPGINSTYHIKKISNNGATVTIVGPNGTELIDGATSLVLTTWNEGKTLHEDGTSYFIY